MVSRTVSKKQAISVLVSVLCTCVIIFTVLNVNVENIQKQIKTRFHPGFLQVNTYPTGNTASSSKTEGNEPAHYCRIYDLKARNPHDFHCVIMNSKPRTPICLHDIAKDKYVSKALAKGVIYEGAHLSELAGILNKDPNMGLIDIGGNIGLYSLYAAQAGHNVVTVEPFMENVIRFHKAAQLGNTTNKITLVRNAVADVHRWATFIRSSDNQGNTQIKLGSGKECKENCSDIVNTIFLDDLLEVINFKTAVMKIDCEGYEHYAFSHAEKLLNQVDIKAIFMEWDWMKKWYKRINAKDRLLVEDLIELLKQKGFRPHTPKDKGSRDLSGKTWDAWTWNIVWHRTTK